MWHRTHDRSHLIKKQKINFIKIVLVFIVSMLLSAHAKKIIVTSMRDFTLSRFCMFGFLSYSWRQWFDCKLFSCLSYIIPASIIIPVTNCQSKHTFWLSLPAIIEWQWFQLIPGFGTSVINICRENQNFWHRELCQSSLTCPMNLMNFLYCLGVMTVSNITSHSLCSFWLNEFFSK